MNKLFENFLDELKATNPTHSNLIEAIKEGAALVEGPWVWGGQSSGSPTSKKSEYSKATSDDQLKLDNENRTERERLAMKKANALKGVQTHLINAAKIAPLEVESIIKSDHVLKAIKAGKQELDEQFGTDTSKRSIWDRTKGAVKSFTESEEGESNTKWATIIYLDGSEAEEVLEMLDSETSEDPTLDVATHLSEWDYGGESEYDLSDEAPWGRGDYSYEVSVPNAGDYVLAYNTAYGYVSLNREVTVED